MTEKGLSFTDGIFVGAGLIMIAFSALSVFHEPQSPDPLFSITMIAIISISIIFIIVTKLGWGT